MLFLLRPRLPNSICLVTEGFHRIPRAGQYKCQWRFNASPDVTLKPGGNNSARQPCLSVDALNEVLSRLLGRFYKSTFAYAVLTVSHAQARRCQSYPTLLFFEVFDEEEISCLLFH